MFLVAHSRTAGTGYTADGNRWQTWGLGQHVTFGGRVYEVTARHVVAKHDLAGVPGLWEHRPGRLVLITCEATNTDARNVVVELDAVG